jgi:hypothetical protein
MRRHFLLLPIVVLIFGAGTPQPGGKQLPGPVEGKKKATPAEKSYGKVEITGTLKLGLEGCTMGSADHYPPLARPLQKQSLIVTVYADELFLRLYFGQDKKLLQLAKDLKGKPVVATGKLRSQTVNVGEGGAVSRLHPPTLAETWGRAEYYLEVDSLKAVGPKP